MCAHVFLEYCPPSFMMILSCWSCSMSQSLPRSPGLSGRPQHRTPSRPSAFGRPNASPTWRCQRLFKTQKKVLCSFWGTKIFSWLISIHVQYMDRSPTWNTGSGPWITGFGGANPWISTMFFWACSGRREKMNPQQQCVNHQVRWLSQRQGVIFGAKLSKFGSQFWCLERSSLQGL